MANRRHLKVAKQGSDAWYNWRRENRTVTPDLSDGDLRKVALPGADLSDAKLYRADMTFADLSGAVLRWANLSKAQLDSADLSGANLESATLHWTTLKEARLGGADLTRAALGGADLTRADLGAAILKYAQLSEANLTGANFKDAYLFGADLDETHFYGTDLGGANFEDASLFKTVFNDVDLSKVKGLESARHYGPSEISISTLYRSEGRIPEVFLRGCGVPDGLIAFARALVETEEPARFSSCFISFSSKDEEVARRLHADLQSRGVRCWFAPHDMRIGDEIRTRIDEMIRGHDKVLLVLSENSVSSTWVQKEVETALERERELGRTMLFPVRVDDSVMDAKVGWPADVRRARHIGDFRSWRDRGEYQKALARLLDDLRASA